MAFYAWSTIKGGTAEKPVTVERGDAVTQKDLGVDDANWAALLESGAVREKKFPAPKEYDGSVIDFLRDQLAEAQSSVDEEEAASELARVSTPPAPSVEDEKK